MAIPGNFLSSTTESIDPNTSGWTTKLNCTLTKGIGGRNGDGCLVVKSVVAGETQARTVSSYAVVAGTTYQVFADTAGVVAERIGIRWLNAAGTEISVTWSLPTLGFSSSWHRVGVAGVAPAGVATAQVLLSATEVGATVNHYWENVYLGLPVRTTGNLFGFGTESSEVDASGWTPLANATISRQVPVVQWAVDNYTAGGHTIAMTAVAAGNASILAINGPAVTPDVEYLAYAYLQPPVLTATAWIELLFFDAVGNQIASYRSVLAAPGTGMYRQRVSAKAPDNAASCSVTVGLDGASAGQILRIETVVVTAAPQLQAGTVVPYADASLEQGIGQWTVASGVATLTRSTPWGAQAIDGSYSLTVSSATATASVVRSGKFPVPGAPGVNYRAQVTSHVTAGTWSSVNVRIRWFDEGNVDLGASTGVSWSLPGSGWYWMAADGVAPAGATQASIELTATATSVSSVLQVDAAALWQVLPLTAVAGFDSDGYARLTLRELPFGFLLRVQREGPDGLRTLVRGTSGLIDGDPIVSDLRIIEDHEAPFGVSFRYHIEILNPDGSLASTRSSEQVTLVLADFNEAWLKDPGNPQRNMRVVVQQAPDWDMPIAQTKHKVRNRTNAVVLSDSRGGLEGDLAVWTRTDEERKALRLLLSSGNTLLWQVAPGMGEDDMYVNVAQVGFGRVSPLAQEQWRTWTLPLTAADMPVTTGINGAAGRTWQDVVAEFATCADLLSVYATCEDLLLDRRTG
ncbi:hypothetical protein AB0I27_22490 [Streptomyces sp. NPDC050597]|uniref:hypothetical protein n=1 Tax=Streptomyces sp. NPDC050597 TaxID=3157212 RepID=UPI0034153C3D